jgi:hypothetical protein
MSNEHGLAVAMLIPHLCLCRLCGHILLCALRAADGCWAAGVCLISHGVAIGHRRTIQPGWCSEYQPAALSVSVALQFASTQSVYGGSIM